MNKKETQVKFKAKVLSPMNPATDKYWAFVVLPKDASSALPRRGRLTIEGKVNNKNFSALLEPDGQKSHWLKLEKQLLEDTNLTIGEIATFEISPADKEPEPIVPTDVRKMLDNTPKALSTW